MAGETGTDRIKNRTAKVGNSHLLKLARVYTRGRCDSFIVNLTQFRITSEVFFFLILDLVFIFYMSI